MNSYPPELLVQLAPVMFVAGLDVPTPPPSSPATPVTPSRPQDPFTVLSLRLRDVLLSQRKVGIWQPNKFKTFQAVLVDKDVRFPPRKTAANAHSPLSPLTPSSPLHPDGLIAPIWIRKHTTLVPSVFVLFLRIYEHTTRGPLEHDPEREQEERRRDAELAGYIAGRKRMTNEHGVKLTVVLLASRRMLDDPTLDARLTFIRKQSGLDARAALFVLSPVSQTELVEFVQSLQQALYDPAVEYYTTHSKRVRRKRNRHTQALSSYSTPLSPMGAVGQARPLRPEGWTVRYEYKMACFAEFRGEDEVALKHYQDAYEVLAVMFGSVAILPPRTKRWAEAKVLADCINVKIVKLYMYNNEHSLALAHHTSHVRKFGDFSRGWSIGEDTFEYWSWFARQYRILAELTDQGATSGLVIPTHTPTSFNTTLESLTTPQAALRSNIEVDALRTLGANPGHALQHPGFYYYMAARCTEERRVRFLALLDNSDEGVANSPGFANEKKVDHLVIILELYTKAYELFKKYSPTTPTQTQARLTLWIAYRIGQTYVDSGKFEMAIRFFERIAKTYRRESWDTMLRPLLTTWYSCVQQLGDVELSIKLLLEMMGQDVEDADEPGVLQDDFMAILKSSVPTIPDEPMVIDTSEAQPLFKCCAVFWSPEVKVGEPAAFQLSINAPSDVLIADLPFSAATITFTGEHAPVTLQHVDGESSNSTTRLINLGVITNEPKTVQANLRWGRGSSLVLVGTLMSEKPTILKVEDVVLNLEHGAWSIQIPMAPSCTGANRWLSSVSPLRYLDIKREDASDTQVRYRPHAVTLEVAHSSPACLDEDYPITIAVMNHDDQELDVVLDVLLQPSEADDTLNTISFGEEISTGLLRGVAFGKLSPGASVSKTLHLVSTGSIGDRILDMSLQTRSTASVPSDASEHLGEADAEDLTELLRTFTIPTVRALAAVQEVVYRRATGPRIGLADLRAFEDDFWDDGQGGEAEVSSVFECAGPWQLEIEGVELKRKEDEQARILHVSVDGVGEDEYPIECLPGDQYSAWTSISISPTELPLLKPVPSLGEYVVKWRRVGTDGEKGPASTSTFALPALNPPLDGLVALLDVAPIARLHQEFPVTLTVRNNHPTRTASVRVYVDPSPDDGFIVAGMRAGRVPMLLPESEETIRWNLIPIECGKIVLPRMRVLDLRKSAPSAEHPEGTEQVGVNVKIIDARTEVKEEPQINNVSQDGEATPVVPAKAEDVLGILATVLVVP
ncbi:hypothetical protein CYLTODRAFT_372663 [Cylindrobasidium torrendii FP15055 ss-10]|uniref:Trafficking protein particle complex subunit 11 n=1 Tax=Cylindrobasidium torrendii FP15055 ss-10 TaxID=1314674 RepID=A0A0D7BHB1_9AGAR|nr:hypothetical protein CYLTODRAFT_372663 [Cylindrobasidium torrendii FP15055 ss-10]